MCRYWQCQLWYQLLAQHAWENTQNVTKLSVQGSQKKHHIFFENHFFYKFNHQRIRDSIAILLVVKLKNILIFKGDEMFFLRPSNIYFSYTLYTRSILMSSNVYLDYLRTTSLQIVGILSLKLNFSLIIGNYHYF